MAVAAMEDDGSHPLTLQERRFLEYLFTHIMPNIKQDNQRWADGLNRQCGER